MSRDYTLTYINGVRYEVRGEQAFVSLGRFLRYELDLTGTKLVCEEGDCGSCTVLIHNVLETAQTSFKAVNSCIIPMGLLDGAQIVTVEGVQAEDGTLHPVQKAMIECHGAQCGYCTPGFICSMASLTDELVKNESTMSLKKAQNYLTGNLCRCTGYKGILDAAMAVELSEVKPLFDRYHNDSHIIELLTVLKEDVEIKTESDSLYIPCSIENALLAISRNTRLVGGATDLGVMANKNSNFVKNYISLRNIKEFYTISEADSALVIGANVTLDRLEQAALKDFPDFSHFLHIFASLQIKNNGTLVGNVANASPIGDSLPFLMVCEARINIVNQSGRRQLCITDFYKAYKKTDLAIGEVIESISIPQNTLSYKFYKVSTRKDLDISTVSMAAAYKITDGEIEDMRLSFGGVAATVIRIKELEVDFIGHQFERHIFESCAHKIKSLVKPLSDFRASEEYRLKLCHNLILKLYADISSRLIEQEKKP